MCDICGNDEDDDEREYQLKDGDPRAEKYGTTLLAVCWPCRRSGSREARRGEPNFENETLPPPVVNRRKAPAGARLAGDLPPIDPAAYD